ncbi:MAG: tol-pal system protein YbgF [Ghiorsea sp.]|nr:tol-pal system protein YbgF [Ghiorsea sp.]
MKLSFLRLKPSTLSVALSLVLLTGCMAEKQPDAWLADKNLVIQSLQDAHMNNAKLKKNVELLDQRVITLESKQARQGSKITALEATLAKKEKVKQQAKKKKKIKKQSKILNDKLDKLSAKLNPALIKPTVVKPTVIKPLEANAAVLTEKNAYTAAYLALKSGRYDESSYGFSAVIQAHPEGVYTDQAYYWLGESLIAQHRDKEAIDAFKLVANKYKKSPKHAASLLKLAAVYQTLSRPKNARSALERVIKEHPDSRSAERARIQLDNLAKKSGAKNK